MRVAIAGAGAVGRSIARELIANGHEVLLIDKEPDVDQARAGARTPSGCSPTPASCPSLEEAQLDQCDVVIAATGDDKANLVISLLAKTEFGVPRTVGRVNHPKNEWLFTEAWGVDVNVSTPRIMSALVEEAVTVGDLVRLFTFRQGNANLVELTLPDDSPYVGKPVGPDPVPGERRAGHDPARRPGLRARRRAADRGRRRAAVRRPAPTSRTSSRSCSAPIEHGAPGLERRLPAPARPGSWLRPSSQAIAGQRGQLERPAHRHLEHAEGRRTAVSASMRAEWPASQIGALHDRRRTRTAAPAARSAGCTAGRPAGPRARRSGRR